MSVFKIMNIISKKNLLSAYICNCSQQCDKKFSLLGQSIYSVLTIDLNW